jgi:hypothetical protein
MIDIEAGRKFWAFQPLHAHGSPPVADTQWLRSTIDAFVLAKLVSSQTLATQTVDFCVNLL